MPTVTIWFFASAALGAVIFILCLFRAISAPIVDDSLKFPVYGSFVLMAVGVVGGIISWLVFLT